MSVLKIKDNNDVWVDIPTIKGETGDAAGFGTATATVDTGTGTPSCDVTLSGDDTAKNFSFAFHNLMYDDSDLQSDFSDLQDDFTVLQGQFDTAVSAVTTDTEVTDIRVGADGITDTTAGASVRRQFTDLKADINDIVSNLDYGEEEPLSLKRIEKNEWIKISSDSSSTVFICGSQLFDGEWESGTYSGGTGLPVDSGSLYRNKNKYIPIPYGVTNLKVSGASNAMVYFYDEDKDFISYDGMTNDYGITPPSGAVYFNFRAGSELSIKIKISTASSDTFVPIRNLSVSAVSYTNVNSGDYVFSYDTVTIQEPIGSHIRSLIVKDDMTDIPLISDGMVIFGNQHTIDLGKHFVLSPTQTPNVYQTPYVASSNENIYKVFVSKTLDPLNGNQSLSDGYNSTLWLTFSDIANNKKLVPVLTWNDMLSTNDCFYYDGANIWVNSNSDGIIDAVLSQKEGVVLDGINAELNNLTIMYAFDSALKLKNGASVKCHNCCFMFSGTESNVDIKDADGIFIGCKSIKARYDGFGITAVSGKSYTEFIDCIGSYCYDDGISHHNSDCTFVISGGEYAYNHKGGVASPTYGSHGKIDNVYSHHNGYGVYAIANSRVDKPLIVTACLLSGNKQNVVGQNIDIIMNKCTSVDHTMWDDEVISGGTLTVY